MKETFDHIVLWEEYKLYKHDRLSNLHIEDYKWRKKYPNAAIHFEEFFNIKIENQGDDHVTYSADWRDG